MTEATNLAEAYAASVARSHADDRGGTLDDATVELIREAWADGYNLYVAAARERVEDQFVLGMDEFDAAVRAEFKTGRPNRRRGLTPPSFTGDVELTEDEYVAEMTRQWQHLAMTSHANMFEAMRSVLKFEGIPYETNNKEQI